LQKLIIERKEIEKTDLINEKYALKSLQIENNETKGIGSSQNISSLAFIPNLESLCESTYEFTPSNKKKQDTKIQSFTTSKFSVSRKKETLESLQNLMTPKQNTPKSLVFSKVKGLTFAEQTLQTSEDTYKTPKARINDFNSPKASRFSTPALNFDGMNRLWEKNVKQYCDITKKNRTNSVTHIDTEAATQRTSLVISNVFKHQENQQRIDMNKKLQSRLPSSFTSRQSSYANVKPGFQAVPLVQYITVGSYKENNEDLEGAAILNENVSKRLGIKKIIQKNNNGGFVSIKKKPTFIKIKKREDENIQGFQSLGAPKDIKSLNLNLSRGPQIWKLTPKHSKMVLETSRPQSKSHQVIPNSRRSLSITGLSRVLP